MALSYKKKKKNHNRQSITEANVQGVFYKFKILQKANRYSFMGDKFILKFQGMCYKEDMPQYYTFVNNGYILREAVYRQ